MASGLISVDDALGFIAAHRADYGVERVSLDDALGGVLAEPVRARLTQPPLAVSAMDGYAVRLADVAAPGARLKVIGESPAGGPFADPVSVGEAVRIFTGGALPPGADHIVIQEDAAREGDEVVIAEGHAKPRHVRAAGIDFENGETLIQEGVRVGPAEIAIAAAANHAELVIARRPRVAVIANGDELKPPGSALGPGEIVSSNPAGLCALIRAWGFHARATGVAADTTQSIQDHIRAAAGADVIVPVGGASVGDRDLMHAAFAGLGFDKVFAKIAVKPGKPTWFGRLGDQRVLGLPGNPASAFVCAHLFLKPLLGLPALATGGARLAAPVPANGGRENYLRARAERGADGVLLAQPASNQDSSLLRPFLTANCLIRRPAGADALAPGAQVDILWLGAGPGASAMATP